MEMNFCRRCGTKLTQKDASSFTCENDHTLYVNSAPTVGIFIFDQSGKLLISRRGIDPGKDMLDSVGGFVDGLETAEEAALREMEEETGIKPSDCTPLEFVCTASTLYHFDGEDRNVLSTFFVVQLENAVVPIAADDVAEIITISLDDIDLDLFHGEDVKAALIALQDLVLE